MPFLAENQRIQQFILNSNSKKYLVFLILAVFLAPLFARADSSFNSQNAPLLQASAIAPFSENKEVEVKTEGGALLPEVGPLGTAADIVDIPESDEISIYTVRKGDTVNAIAEMYGVTANTIRWANDLAQNETLKEGQILIILPITGVIYEVKKGDTLAGISKKLNSDTKDIALYNDLAPDAALAVGQTIIVPNGELQFTSSQTRVSKTTTGKRKERTFGTNAPEYSGYYIRPILGGRRSQGLHGFNGVDLAAPTGTPIMAAANGTVIKNSFGTYGGGYGNYIIIMHDNGTQTLYAHNSKNLVKYGDRVEQGQTIATVGSTGRSTGPHVHFEVRGGKNPGGDGSWATQ